MVYDLENLLAQYRARISLYEDFCDRTTTIVRDILNLSECDFLSVEARVKTESSLKDKIEKKKDSPKDLSEIEDIVGIRVITFVYKDIEEIAEVLQKNFLAKEVEVEKRLSIDQIGYRSRHWIATLPVDRLKLAEYARFDGLKAEIQVRTILQHAWAQIGHDQIYKPSSILPEKIERDFTLLSGLLEIADNEFSRISGEIRKHQQDVLARTKKGDLDIPIDSVSLRQFFDTRFGKIKTLVRQFGPNDNMAEEIIEELKNFGILTLEELNNIIPPDLEDKVNLYDKESNYCSLPRNIMVIRDAERYFKDAWNRHWTLGSMREAALYKSYGVDMDTLSQKYNLG